MVKTILGSVLENSSIEVPVTIAGYSVDPANGNPIPNTRTYIVKCLLNYVEKPPKQFANSQPNDSPMYWVEGNVSEVLDPLTPSVLLPPAMLDGVTREGLNAKIGNTEGIFYPIVRIKETELNPYLDLNILGEEIWGWFDVKTKVPD